MNKLIASALSIVALVMVLAIAMQWWLPKTVELSAATWLGDEHAKPLPDFELTSHLNQPFNSQSLVGKWHLMFFGYTHCPDICPETMQLLSGMTNKLDESTLDNLQITFVSVDPERDTLENMEQYVTYFNPDFLSVTGEMEQINLLTSSVGVLHYKTAVDDSQNYEVAHSGTLILTDPKGRFIGMFSTPLDPVLIADDLNLLVNS